MVQPKKPPVSLRLPEGLADRVQAWAEARKITRNAAYARLLDAGLQATGPSLPTPQEQAIMKEAARAFRLAASAESENRAEAAKDVKFAKGATFAGRTALGEPLKKPLHVNRLKTGGKK